MIFLDANAFYWYYGRDKLGLPISNNQINTSKLCQYLNNRKDKALPVSTYIEIFTHFRDDAEKLIVIRDFIITKKFRLYNNLKEYGIMDKDINFISVMTSYDIVQFANDLLNEKIEIESRYANLFLSILRELYLYYVMNEYKSLNDKNKDSILRYTWDNIWKQEDETQTRLTTALKKDMTLTNQSKA